MQQTRRRVSSARQLCALAVWVGAVAFVLVVARWTSIGPAVVGISPTHGVHAGDVLTGLVALGVAAVSSRWIVRADRAPAASCR